MSFKGLNTKSCLARIPGNPILGTAYFQPASNLKIPGYRLCIIYLVERHETTEISDDNDTFLITRLFDYLKKGKCCLKKKYINKDTARESQKTLFRQLKTPHYNSI